jgi:hypothetical protein
MKIRFTPSASRAYAEAHGPVKILAADLTHASLTEQG